MPWISRIRSDGQMETVTWKEMLAAARAMKAIGLDRSRLGSPIWRSSVRDQARASKPRSPLPSPFGEAGWWVETDPVRRAELERLASEAVVVECRTCDDARFIRVGIAESKGTSIRLQGMPPVVSKVRPCPDCNLPSEDDLVARAGIPRLYAEATFETFRAELGKGDALIEVQTWADGGTSSLVIVGMPGRGKTHLAVAALRYRIERGTPGIFEQAVSLMDRFKAGFADGSNEAIEQRVRETPVLVLDDIGAARPTEWARDRIAALIEARMIEGRPTIITSDKTGQALMDAGYDARLISRFKTFTVVRVDGADMRGMK